MPTKTCQNAWCQAKFEITPTDQTFYTRIGVPAPTLCPECRQQRRLAFRNERKLYHRKCDFTGKQIISMYAPDCNFKVYDQQVWWSDRWDSADYGKNFDFTKTFFEQFRALLEAVPRLGLNNFDPENSEYCNQALHSRNCYLLFAANTNEDVHYSYWCFNCSACIDCSFLYECELCYGSLDLKKCYNVHFSQICSNTHDALFCFDCVGVADCVACVGLRNKQYCIFNRQYTKEEYERQKKNLDLGSSTGLMKTKKMYEQFLKTGIRKNLNGINNHGSTGDYLINTKNCLCAFDLEEGEDCKYIYCGRKIKDSMDCSYSVKCELSYDCLSSADNVYYNLFSSFPWGSTEIFYSDSCYNSKNLFGCVGARHKQYCILNQQYSRAEYEQLVPKIIKHMQKTGEWGEFFPVTLSPFAYNETVAQEYFPLTKKAVLAHGWQWKDEEKQAGYIGPKVELPDRIEDTSDEILKQVLTCEISGRNYKIIPQELDFYRRLSLPIPRRCPDQRHLDRLALRNPRKLWTRECGKCKKLMQTTYAPTRPELVYCEECYLKEIN